VRLAAVLPRLFANAWRLRQIARMGRSSPSPPTWRAALRAAAGLRRTRGAGSGDHDYNLRHRSARRLYQSPRSASHVGCRSHEAGKAANAHPTHGANQLAHLFSLGTAGRPGLPRRTFQAQNRRKPCRCQPMTVEALMIRRWIANRSRLRSAKPTRTAGVSLGRWTERCRTLSGWRRAGISSWSAARLREEAQSAVKRAVKRADKVPKGESKEKRWSRGVTRWFRWSLSVADPFVCRCLTNPTLLRFHAPLIEPDMRDSRIRLPEKGSRSPTENCASAWSGGLGA